MKKTIAALLVTILASAGYVVLDKTAAQKIDTLASQVSSQQVVLEQYNAGYRSTADMQIGDTLPCVLPESGTISAAVYEWVEASDMTTPTATTTTTTTATITMATTTTTKPQIVFYEEPCSTTRYEPMVTGEADVSEPDMDPDDDLTTAKNPDTTGGFYMYHGYAGQANVTIDAASCTLSGKDDNGVSEFTLILRGKTDPKYAGYTFSVSRGDSFERSLWDSASVAQDGSFFLRTTCSIAYAHPIVLRGVELLAP